MLSSKLLNCLGETMGCLGKGSEGHACQSEEGGIVRVRTLVGINSPCQLGKS